LDIDSAAKVQDLEVFKAAVLLAKTFLPKQFVARLSIDGIKLAGKQRESNTKFLVRGGSNG